MREIKFRAWDKRDIENPPSMYYFDFKTAHQFVRCGNIMQYTGLKDRNGEEIYESDIVNSHDGLFVIKYSEEKMAYGLYSKGVEYPWYVSKYSLEIIGNIHENPELLNK